MAKNFLDQAFSILGLKSPGTTDYYDPSVYKTETNISVNKPTVSKSPVAKKMTGVDKYQQRKKLPHPEAKELSGVEKYLATKQAIKETPTEECTEKQLTGVAKYLSLKQQVEQSTIDNMTGVAKYLYYLDNPHKKPAIIKSVPEVENEEAPAELSRVDRYIAKQKEAALEKQTEKTVVEPPENEPEITPAVKENLIAQVSKEKEKEKTVQATDETAQKIIDLSVEGKRCQAATGKGTQCSRKNNLQTIERTINAQEYKFSVCRQHNIDSFIPYEKLLQE